MNIKECEGCYTKGNCDNYSKFKDCPCIKCLVKVTCCNPCEEYEVFSNAQILKEFYDV